jgi:hypothetical protein
MVDDESNRKFWEKLQAEARRDIWKEVGGLAFGLLIMASSVWMYYDMRDFEANGGTRFLIKPVALMYDLFGAIGAAAAVFALGLGLAGLCVSCLYDGYKLIHAPPPELTPEEREKHRRRAERKQRRAQEASEQGGSDRQP